MAPKTDDPTKRYSDEAINPSNKAFDDIVDTPDMRALDDQGNAIASGLKAKENDAAKLPSDNASDASGVERGGLEGFYRREGLGKAVSAKGISRNKRRKIGAAVGGGGLIGALIGLAFMLLPLKIPAIMTMIAGEAGQRVEQVTEHRAKMIVARAIAQKFAVSGSGVVVEGGVFKTLVASMRTNNFEKRLADKGLTIEKTSDGVRLKLKDGTVLGGGELKNEVQIKKALESNNLSNKMVKDIVKEEIPSWRWMKRAKFAKWLRHKYGIPRYGITNNNDPETMEKERLKAEVDANSNSNSIFMGCVTSPDSGCELIDGETSDDGSKKSGNSSDVTGSLDSVSEEAIDTAASGSTQDASEFISKELTAKFAAKAIPIVGWIDLAATISHLVKAEAEDDFIGKAVAGLKERNYAQLNGFWSGYGSQVELGAMNTSYIAKLAKQTEGIEKAQAFNLIEGTTKTSKPVTIFQDTAYAVTAKDIPGVPVDRIDSNNPGYIKNKLDDFNGATGGVASFAGKPVSEVLEVWYQTIGEGGVLGFVGSWVGKGFAAITPEAAEEWASKYMEKGWAKMLEMFGLDFNPFVSGAKWFNNAHAGATASYNSFGNEMGLRKLSPTQAGIQNMSIAAERSSYIKEKGAFYALFSNEVNGSLTNQIAVSAPSDITQLGTNVSSFLAKAPLQILASIFPSAKAANPYVDLYGVDPYGATDSDLNAPLATEFIDGEECPEVPEGSFDTCNVDTLVAETMLCDFEPESEGCDGEGDSTAQSTTAPFDFTVGSYNILHSESHTDKSIDLGGCRKNPVQGDPRCAKTRGARQVKIITGESGNPAFDIFGTQETAPEQYNYLKANLPGYAAFPESTERMNNMDDGAVSIFWNTSKFTMFENGKAPGKSNTAKDISNPWVGLQTSTGQKMYVMSIHYAQSDCSDGNCNNSSSPAIDTANMKESSRLTLEWVKSKATADTIVIVLGDFNDTLRQKLSYCAYTKESLLQHAVDMTASASVNEGCTKDRFSGIDHIYATPTLNLTASGWTQMSNTGEVAQASDHVPVYTSYSIPGSASLTGAGSKFRMATFNISVKMNKNDWAKSVSAMTKNKMDIIGTQELEKDSNYFFIQKQMKAKGYGIYPDKNANENIVRHGLNARSILYNTTKFNLVKTDMFRIPRYDDGPAKSGDEVILAGQANVPIVWLQDRTTQQQLIVINTHNVAYAENAKRRYDSSLIYIEQIKRLQAENPGVPIFLTGDFNEGTGVRFPPKNATYQGKSENLLYCMFASNKLMVSTETASKGRAMNCPNQSVGGVDYIYAQPGIMVSNFTELSRVVSGSDHPSKYVDVEIPGGGSSGAGEWSWPLGIASWKSIRAEHLEGHSSTGTAWGGDNMGTSGKGPGIASDISLPTGAPVYAMLGGTVTSTDLCGENDGIAIKSNISGATIGISYMHGTSQKFNVGDTVKSGDQIMNTGLIGCSVRGAHLHIGIAYKGRYVCPQDIFLAMDKSQAPNLAEIANKAAAPCGR